MVGEGHTHVHFSARREYLLWGYVGCIAWKVSATKKAQVEVRSGRVEALAVWWEKAAAQGHWTAIVGVQMIKLDYILQPVGHRWRPRWEWRARMLLWTILLVGGVGFAGCVVLPGLVAWWVVSSAAAATARVVRVVRQLTYVVLGGVGRGLSKARGVFGRGVFAFGRVRRRLSDRSGTYKVCWEQPLEVLLRPCRHVALCQLCAPR
jgi:hypothetical protein